MRLADRLHVVQCQSSTHEDRRVVGNPMDCRVRGAPAVFFMLRARSRSLGTLQEVIATVDGSDSPSFDSLELRGTATEAPAATGFI